MAHGRLTLAEPVAHGRLKLAEPVAHGLLEFPLRINHDKRSITSSSEPVAALVGAAVLFALPVAGATTYYVSPAGADGNDGTAPERAWQSIDRVNKAALQPGDRILFEGGQRFGGHLLLANSGTAAAFITVGSYGEGLAQIEGGDSFGIRLLNCQYVEVHNLILRGSGVTPDGRTTNTEQGLDIYSSATRGKPWQSVYADRLTVSGFRDGIALHTPVGKQEVVGYNDVRITNCTIEKCQFNGFYCWGGER